MKTLTTLTSLVGLASATGWLRSGSFNCPANTDNQCNDQQKSGFDWSGISQTQFSSYGQFSFSGFTYANSFGKRDPLTKRTFQSKCIKGSVSASSGPKINCGSQSSGFSATEYQISVSEDTDIEFRYTMKDGSTCKHVSRCQKGGSVVQNSQCGGAQEVEFRLPSGSKSSGCDIGVHSMGFDCNPPSGQTGKTSPTSAPAAKSSSGCRGGYGYCGGEETKTTFKTSTSTAPCQACEEKSTTSPAPTAAKSSPGESKTQGKTESKSESKPAAGSPPAASSPPPAKETSSKTSGQGVPGYGNSTSQRPSTSPPSAETKASSQEVKTTPKVPSTTPASPETSKALTSPPASSPSLPSTGCPDVLPKCLNTWISQTSCKDNSDWTCYCSESSFTASVIDCVSAWGVDTTEIQAALTYLVGLCAAYVPQNPGLITNCPSTIPIGPTGKPGNGGQGQGSTGTVYLTSTATVPCSQCKSSTPVAGVTSAPPAIPYTTVMVATTVTIPCTYSTGVSLGLTIPSSSTVTAISIRATVPQVQLTTAAGTTGSVVSLGYGSPTAAPVTIATTTAVAGVTPAGGKSTFSVLPKASNTTSAAIVQFTGAAVSNNGRSAVGALAAGAMAILLL